jgi:alpha-glucosidase
VYQVYVRSFADSNGDGIGDLDGVRSRLSFLHELGVDAIWLNPCYPSPQHDHGYDVAEYCDIEPDYGDLATFDQLVAEATELGIRVLMDIVPNHCSSEHPWFRAALDTAPGSPERARFYFRDGSGPEGSEPPNNWQAVFGGSAWTQVPDGQWYLGTFTTHQPDFDHTNPEVAQFFDDVLRFWFDRGVEGFRVDAVTPVGKAAELPDAPPVPIGTPETEITFQNPYTAFRPEGHVVWKRWRRLLEEYMEHHPGRDLMIVAEAYTPRRPDLLLDFATPEEFHQCFAFDLMLSPWEISSLRQGVGDQLLLLEEFALMPTWTLNNHDAQRIVTRLGREGITSGDSYTGSNLVYPVGQVDLEVGTRRARALITLILALPGSVYLYQGEELGLPEVLDLADEVRQDPIFARTAGRELGRDGCRIPLPWTTDPDGAHGFSASDAPAPPWLPQPDNWGRFAAEAQFDDEQSMLSLYRRLLTARRLHALAQGPVAQLVQVGPDLLGVRRGNVLAVLNPTDSTVELDLSGDLAPMKPGDLHLLVSSAEEPAPTRDTADPTRIAADTAVWFQIGPPPDLDD